MNKRFSFLGWMTLFTVVLILHGTVAAAEKKEDSQPVLENFDATNRLLFEAPQKGDAGFYPCVALNSDGDVMLVAAQSQHEDTTLFLRQGKLNRNNTVSWGPLQNYDTGTYPSIALTDPVGDGKQRYFIETHYVRGSGGDSWQQLYWHLGRLDEDGIHIAKKIKGDHGEKPSVTMDNSGFFVQVHESNNKATLWYRCGQFSFDKMEARMEDSIEYDRGYWPSVAMIREGEHRGFVVEVHMSSENATLWYRLGQADPTTRTLKWSPGAVKYDNGLYPSVAVNNDGLVLEMHRSDNYQHLWYRVGQIDFDNWTIAWGSSYRLDPGLFPSVAINDRFALQVHPSSKEALWYSGGILTDYSRWMQDLMPYIGNTPLWQITLPGTHDAAMYYTRDILIKEYNWAEELVRHWVREHWCQTQNESILEQLRGGIRYFDLRPAVYFPTPLGDPVLYMYHSFAGPTVQEVLKDVQQFMYDCQAQNANELVVLAWSHFYEFDGDFDFKPLTQMVNEYLGEFLYTVKNPDKVDFLKMTYGQLIDSESGQRPTVLFLVEKGDYDYWVRWGGDWKPPAGVWPYQKMSKSSSPDNITGGMRIIDDYADTPDHYKMESDQKEKLLYTKGGNDQRSFLLSWTLTASTDWKWWYDRYTGKAPHSIYDMSFEVKNDLAPFLRRYASTYEINMLYTDYWEDAATPLLAVLMNKGFLSAGPEPPTVKIRANGEADFLLVRPETPVMLSLNLDPGYRENLNADWWIAAHTPSGWYSYVKGLGWQEGQVPYDQTALREIPETLEIPSIKPVEEGVYTYYFAVDDEMDGLPDVSWLNMDQVSVNVTYWR
jgi:hypothetical protein